MGNGSTTYSHTSGTSLTLGVLKDAMGKLREMGRFPVFHFSTLADNVYHGELVDEMFGKFDYGFNKDIHKGYIIPISLREIVLSHISLAREI